MHFIMSSAKWQPSCLGLNLMTENMKIKSIVKFTGTMPIPDLYKIDENGKNMWSI